MPKVAKNSAQEPVGITSDSETRTPERQSASKWGTTSSLEIPVGSFSRRIQATSLDVCFDLTIPPIGHEALEPFREAGELLGRESCYCRFKILNTHNAILLYRYGACNLLRSSRLCRLSKCYQYLESSIILRPVASRSLGKS